MMTLKFLLALISLASTVLVWWIKANNDDKAEKSRRKEDIKDAVFSGDVSRINAVIQRLRKP